MLQVRMSAPRVVPRMSWTGSEAVLAFASLWPVVKSPPVPAYRKTPFGAKPQTAFFHGCFVVAYSLTRGGCNKWRRTRIALQGDSAQLAFPAIVTSRVSAVDIAIGIPRELGGHHKAPMNSRAGLHPLVNTCMAHPTKEQRQRWYENNREKRFAQQRAYNEKNKELRRKWNSEWKAKNKSNGNFHKAARVAAKIQATPKWADLKVIREIYAKSSLLGLTVDHIVPLRHKIVCGLHVECNLQLMDGTENSRNGNRHWPDMPES